MATLAFGPVPEESRLLGKRRKVISIRASRTRKPAASKLMNKRSAGCLRTTRGDTAYGTKLCIVRRFMRRSLATRATYEAVLLAVTVRAHLSSGILQLGCHLCLSETKTEGVPSATLRRDYCLPRSL